MTKPCFVMTAPATHGYAFFIFGRKRNADENEIPFWPKKTVTCAYITELSYGSVANVTLSAQRN